MRSRCAQVQAASAREQLAAMRACLGDVEAAARSAGQEAAELRAATHAHTLEPPALGARVVTATVIVTVIVMAMVTATVTTLTVTTRTGDSSDEDADQSGAGVRGIRRRLRWRWP